MIKRVKTIENPIPVKIQLKTVVEQEGQIQQFTFDEVGELASLNGAHYLRYHETSSQEGSVPVTIKFSDDGTITLSRNASSRLRVTFDHRRDHETHYQTAYGMIKMTVKTTKLLSQLNLPTGIGNVAVDYELSNQGQLLGKYQIRLQFSA